MLKMEANTQDCPFEPATTTSSAMDGLTIPGMEQQLAALQEELRITKNKVVERDGLVAEAEEKAKLDDAILEATAGLLQAQARMLHETRENVKGFLRSINMYRPRNNHAEHGEDAQAVVDRDRVSR